MQEEKQDLSTEASVKVEEKNEASDLPEDIIELQQKAGEYLEGWQRARADYQNLKKDNEKRQAEVVQYANAGLISELLPIYNNYKLACNHIPVEHAKDDWVQGFVHIKNQLAEFFNQLGIIEIKTVGEKFNPDIHEALEQVETNDFESNVVCEEISPGYLLHDKLVQVAKVKVSK